jgi:hypothetical protein
MNVIHLLILVIATVVVFAQTRDCPSDPPCIFCDNCEWKPFRPGGSLPYFRYNAGKYYMKNGDRESIFMYGGMAISTYNSRIDFQSDLWEYDINANLWRRRFSKSDAEPNIFLPSLIVMNKKVYIFGGQRVSDFQFNNDIWEYDPALSEWNIVEMQGDELPGLSYTTDMLKLNEFEFLLPITIAGTSQGINFGAITELWKADLQNKTWTKLSDDFQLIPGLSVNAAFTIVGNAVLGMLFSDSVNTMTFLYQPELKKWKQLDGEFPIVKITYDDSFKFKYSSIGSKLYVVQPSTLKDNMVVYTVDTSKVLAQGSVTFTSTEIEDTFDNVVDIVSVETGIIIDIFAPVGIIIFLMKNNSNSSLGKDFII